MRRSWLGLKWLLIASLLASLLTGCGSSSASASAGLNYPLESVSGSGDDWSRVYRVAGKTVPEVADELAAAEKPQEISDRQTERMFLVYADRWIHLQQDAAKPEDTLVEVSSRAFVEKNYDGSFLQTYFTAMIIGELVGGMFDSIGKSKSSGKYRGYSSRDTYKPAQTYRKPTEMESKSAPPPATKQGSGSIVRRGDSQKVGSGSAAGSGADQSVGDSGSITKKKTATGSDSGTTGSITRNNSSSSTVKPKTDSGSTKKSITSKPSNKSPPKTKVGGSGKITKRR